MAFAELKARQSVMWGNGPYERITNTLRDIHELVIERADPKPGEQVLDAATGTGAVAILAAKRGADVVGQDLAPVLIETARERAAEEGVEVQFEVGDAEAMTYDGCELRRRDVDVRRDVRARPRGRRSRARAGHPAGRTARTRMLDSRRRARQMFRMMGPFLPPPAPGAGSPFAWGNEEHVRELLGDDLRARLRGARLDARGRVRRGVLGALLHLVRADEDRRRGARPRSPRGVPPDLGRVLRSGIAKATRSCTTANTSSRSARADSASALGE